MMNVQARTEGELPKREVSPSQRFCASSKWKRLRKKFLAKHVDPHTGWYRCAMCGQWTMHPEVDHIIKRSVAPHLVFEESNLQVLDRNCHQIKDGGMRRVA